MGLHDMGDIFTMQICMTTLGWGRFIYPGYDLVLSLPVRGDVFFLLLPFSQLLLGLLLFLFHRALLHPLRKPVDIRLPDFPRVLVVRYFLEPPGHNVPRRPAEGLGELLHVGKKLGLLGAYGLQMCLGLERWNL